MKYNNLVTNFNINLLNYANFLSLKNSNFLFKNNMFILLNKFYQLDYGFCKNEYISNSEYLTYTQTRFSNSIFYFRIQPYKKIIPTIKNSFFTDFLTKNALKHYYTVKSQYFLKSINKRKNLLKKIGIVVGETNFNYILNVDGVICNVKKGKNKNKLYDLVLINSINLSLKKKKKFNKINSFKNKSTFFKKTYKVKNFYYECQIINTKKNNLITIHKALHFNKNFYLKPVFNPLTVILNTHYSKTR